jgi:hypothetical protein
MEGTPTLFKSSDRGRTWQRDRTITNLDDNFASPYRLSAVVGSEWVFAAMSRRGPVLTKVGPGTTDARAATFKSAAPYSEYGVPSSVSFATPDYIWLVPAAGNLLASADGGVTWTDITPGAKPHVIHPLNGPSSSVLPPAIQEPRKRVRNSQRRPPSVNMSLV